MGEVRHGMGGERKEEKENQGIEQKPNIKRLVSTGTQSFRMGNRPLHWLSELSTLQKHNLSKTSWLGDTEQKSGEAAPATSQLGGPVKHLSSQDCFYVCQIRKLFGPAEVGVC